MFPTYTCNAAQPAPAPPGPLQKYWDMRNHRPHYYVSARMIEASFKQSLHWQGVAAELAQPFDRSQADPRALASTK